MRMDRIFRKEASMPRYRLERWYYTVYGATAYEQPLFFRSFIVAWAVKMVCGLWWEVYLERVD